ncbi:hypothetical protein EKO04_005246 [Ascochyta lentis]|uniref:SH3 domain-containing protein n=1 Tax=Ascochyta lentis TaxID=205686 RepID=A0A8H7J242_9PLEO|nr:hypothetical protein EKO04_005246 [Ascochyta lentis]
MAHQHGHAHLVRRQRNRQEEDGNPVATVVELVTMANTYTGNVLWVTQQNNGPKTLVPPAVATRPFSTASNDDDDDKKTTSTKPTAAATSRRPASTHTSESEAERTSTAKSTKDQSTLIVATKSPSVSSSASLAGALVSATASATASISATPTSDASESGGMSGGAKAGLALGILLGVAALLAGILFFYRRKRNAMAGEKDNEKISMHDAPAPLPPQVLAGAAPSIRTNRTMSTAPRLSLRPVTQFDPTFNEQRKSGGNLLTVAAAAAPVAAFQDRAASSEERPVSAWERRGAANAAPAETNPFNDPQTPANTQPPANPFGNSAALDAAHAAIPDSPPQASPMHSAAPSADLAARVAPVPAPVAEVDAVAVATAMANVPAPEKEFPAPPSLNANADGVPASPAWTEDVPSSPAMGTPMIVGTAGAAVVAGRPNGAPAGPNNVHRVQLDFKPSMGDELELKAGSLVRMLHEYDDGWALCINMDRSHQGVVPRTCLSKHPVKPRTGPPRQGPPPPHMRGPPIRSPMGPGGIPQPRPMSPADGGSSPHPSTLSPASGRNSPGPHAMSSGPRQMPPPHMQGPPRNRSHSNAPYPGSPQVRGRSNSNAPYAGPPRSMSPGPYGGGPMAPPPQMGRPRSNSANQAGGARRGPAPGPSPMNPNMDPDAGPIPAPLANAVPIRKPVPGMAL